MSTPGEPQASVPSLEQKPVAVLALELTWPVPAEGEAPRYEPWTATRRWEQTIVEKVQGFDGVLLQRSPSLFLVAFGVPRTLEQLPQRAVQAALALRQVVDATPVGGLCPQLRQAVHWGPLVVDAEARDSMGQLLAIGDTLARPVRLLGHTAPGEILVSPEVAPVIENWCALQACERPFRVEPAEQIGAYAVLGLRPRHSPLEMYAQRSLSRFVGRERELAALGDLLVQVEEGRGQVVGIMGEPGIGKSRVCYEFTRTHLTHGWLRLDTSAASYGKGIPYLPVIDLLKAYFQVDAGDDRQTIQVKVTDKLLALETTLEPILPALLVLLGVPVEDPPWQALDPSQRRQRLLDAVNHLWLRESQVQPLCLIVENLHWIDGETQACLDSFVESLPAARVLLLVSYRPDYQHGWTSKTYYTQLRLDPLPSASAYALAHAILGHDPSVRPLTPRLIERTEGNPLFLEESIQTLVETQVLSGERGAYRLAKAWQPMQVPATVHMVLAARIDRLPVEAKRLLQIAAVIGKDVPFSLLQAIGERPAEALRQVVAHLQRAEFLYERSLFPELAYTFKHALTHEVTYGSLQQEQRRALHARIIEAIEALDANGLGEQVERLAHHALRGEMWEKAVTYCRQAGARAHDRAAFREAVTAFEQALQALVYLPEDGDTRVLAIELRLALAHALRGDHGRKRALMGEAATLARTLDDWGRVGRVLAAMAEQLVVTGDFDGAIAAGQEALELATALGDRALQGQASTRLGQAYNAIGAHGRAAELLCWSVEAVDREAGTSSVASRIDARALLVLTLGDLGAFAESRRYGEEALRLATVEGRGIDPMNARSRLGRLYLAQGDLEHAIPVLEQGVALCRASGDWSQLRPTVASLGYAYALLGRLAEGRTLLEEGIREGIRIGGVGNHARWVAWLSEVCRLAGRGEEAYQHARQALDLAQRLKARGDEALALHQLGVVQAHADPPDAAQAEALLQQAMAMADELGMRPLLAHCHLGLGTLYAKIGRREPAGASLSTAIELYRIMDMTFWLPQAEATLAQVE